MPELEALVTTQSEDKKFAICQLKGVIDTATFPNLQSVLYRLRRLGVRQLILEMQEVSYVNSLGFSILVKHSKLFKNEAGELVVANMQPKVQMVSGVLGLAECMRIFPTAKEAQEALIPPGQPAAGNH